MAEKMPISVKLGSRPMISRIRLYSSRLSPWAAIRSGVIVGSCKLSSLTVQICTLIRKLKSRGKVGIAFKCRIYANTEWKRQVLGVPCAALGKKNAGHMARRKSNREIVRGDHRLPASSRAFRRAHMSVQGHWAQSRYALSAKLFVHL